MKRLCACLLVAFFATMSALSASGQSASSILRLLRPEVLRQLNGDMVRLVNELPALDDQNKAIVGRLFAHGGLGHAKLGKDGVHRISVWIPSGQFIWRPAVIVMGHGGDLEIEVRNDDEFSHHQMLLPSNGGRIFMHIPQFERGKARIRLDDPGLYWFGCPVSNHAGRGMLGVIVVKGEVPEEARLDRPFLKGMKKRGPHKGPIGTEAPSGEAQGAPKSGPDVRNGKDVKEAKDQKEGREEAQGGKR
jgi:PQQ system protein